MFRGGRAEAVPQPERWAQGAQNAEPGSPSALQYNAVEVLHSFSHVNRVYLQTSKSPSVPLITTTVSTWCLAWYQKMVHTHKSKLIQKLSKYNNGVTFVLRGEIRNRHLLTPVNIHPSDRWTRVASCKWKEFLPSLQ